MLNNALIEKELILNEEEFNLKISDKVKIILNAISNEMKNWWSMTYRCFEYLACDFVVGSNLCPILVSITSNPQEFISSIKNPLKEKILKVGLKIVLKLHKPGSEHADMKTYQNVIMSIESEPNHLFLISSLQKSL